ncbi:MAG: AbrB/MazE/SpoVT family DNA-binding domain-containing protein [archaeon]
MKRKVVKLGPATLVISLPAKWVQRLNIQAGAEVELEEKDSSLTISLEKEYKREKETLNLSEHESLLKRIFVSKYLKGVDEIEVEFDSLEKSRLIQKRVDELIGMEVVDQSRNSLTVSDMGTSKEDNFDNIMKRVFYLLNSLSDETLKAVKNKETDLEYLEDLEKNLNKFTDYCFRILNKKGYPDVRKTAVLYCILYLLEEVGDKYKKLVSFIQKNKLKLNQDLIVLFTNINEYNKNMQKLFLKFSFEGAKNLAKERDLIIKSINKKLSFSKVTSEVVVLKHFENITENIIKIMGQLLNIN